MPALVPGLAVVLTLTACTGGAPPDEDGAAVALCRAQLSAVDDGHLATTVRDEGGGWVVQAWAPGPPSGDPDHVCRVARDDAAERGARLVHITPSPGPR